MADEDIKDNVEEPQVAPEGESTQDEQVASTEDTTEANPPEDSNSDKGDELILGKFKSQADLEKSYQELERETTRLRQQKPQAPQEQPQIPDSGTNNPEYFDKETQDSLERWYSQKREAEKVAEFRRKHADDLKDPLLDGAVRRIIADANSQGLYKDQEEALAEAKQMLDERTKPQVREAKNEGFEEGAEIARKKQQAGAGGGSKAKEKVDPDSLSAAEFAEIHGLKREN